MKRQSEKSESRQVYFTLPLKGEMMKPGIHIKTGETSTSARGGGEGTGKRKKDFFFFGKKPNGTTAHTWFFVWLHEKGIKKGKSISGHEKWYEMVDRMKGMKTLFWGAFMCVVTRDRNKMKKNK